MKTIVEAPTLSWSQAHNYTQCPAKWYFSRCREPEFTPSSLRFGSAVHNALARYYSGILEGKTPGVDELLAAYELGWNERDDAPVRYGDGEDETSLRDMAGRMLDAFLEAISPGEIIAVEQPFSFELDNGVVVRGIADLVEERDGRVWIIDHKTSRNSPSNAFDREQLMLYRVGLESIGIISPGENVGMRYDVLRKLKTRGEFVSVEIEASDKEIADTVQKLRLVWRAIESGIIYRNPGYMCSGCQWANVCAEEQLP